jgi:hypothetical protein
MHYSHRLFADHESPDNALGLPIPHQQVIGIVFCMTFDQALNRLRQRHIIQFPDFRIPINYQELVTKFLSLGMNEVYFKGKHYTHVLRLDWPVAYSALGNPLSKILSPAITQVRLKH